MDMEFKAPENDNYSQFTDFYQPFVVNECNVRGSFIRLASAVDSILHKHQYPRAVSSLLAEQLVLACMLSGNLEGRSSITMQVKGSEGAPIKFAVVDVNGDGHLRGYAELADDTEARLEELKEGASLQQLLGEKAYLAITMNSGPGGQQYQGIVGLHEDNLAAALVEYFSQSEQIGVSVKVAVDRVKQGDRGVWAASGIMVQRMPVEGGKQLSKKQIAEQEENWNRSEILMQSATDKELLDQALPAQSLLKRLFNEDGVWVYEPRQMKAQCRCSRERVADVLSSFPAEEIESMKNDGKIEVTCQFCNSTETFEDKDIKAIKRRANDQPS